jgi:alkylation response protein AidB-like acyl-CoA dehydrogenase
MITSPDSTELAALCRKLAEMAPELDRAPQWPAEQLRLCGEYGVYEWFIDPQWGGQGWSEEQVVRGYLALSAACLTTTFIITQRTGACRRIEGCDNQALKERWLPGLASGEFFGTVGISHLTTSRRHLARPVLTAEPVPGGFRLDGMAPWVTGGAAADVIVLAATVVAGLSETGLSSGTPSDEQLLIAVPTGLPGMRVAEPLPLVGVSASATGPIHLDQVDVSDEWLIAGPMRHVMASGVGGSTGGLETSTLALGLAGAAIDFLTDESTRRADLQQAAAALRTEHERLLDDLLAAARGETHVSKESVRQRANSLVLRATQAGLSAAKGSGYVVGHPAGRWCREALFFLVWSCPQPVAAANLCELAGIQD